jgi:hypothetical protein
MTAEILGVGTSPAAPTAAPKADAPGSGLSFHDVLSALNPLQYLPVIGTIYRAVTGDVIPEGLRRLGSMLVSGLLGGPIGLGINIVTTIAEKATGIDPEKIISDQINPPTMVAAAPAAVPVPSPGTGIIASSGALTPAQLAAYGVRPDVSGTLKLGTIEGADVLNAIQLAGLGRTAAAAYAANQTRV